MYIALFMGMIAAFIFLKVNQIFDRAHIDDPMKNVSIYGVVGLFGTLSAGFFIETLP